MEHFQNVRERKQDNHSLSSRPAFLILRYGSVLFRLSHIFILATLTSGRLLALTADEVYIKCRQSVVIIECQTAAGKSLGSGFAVGDGTRLVTNYHVIKNAQTITVTTAKGDQLIISETFGNDENADLAVLKLPDVIPPLELVTAKPKVGDVAYALGNPQGFEATFSNGLISAIREKEGEVIYQISVPISQGSSGGPVINADGRVVGVTALTYAEGQNINFAVPYFYLFPLLQIDSAYPLPAVNTVPMSEGAFDEINDLLRKGLTSLATRKALERIKREPENPLNYGTLGWIYYRSEDWARAVPALEMFLDKYYKVSTQPDADYEHMVRCCLAFSNYKLKRFKDSWAILLRSDSGYKLRVGDMYLGFLMSAAQAKFSNAKSFHDIMSSTLADFSVNRTQLLAITQIIDLSKKANAEVLQLTAQKIMEREDFSQSLWIKEYYVVPPSRKEMNEKLQQAEIAIQRAIADKEKEDRKTPEEQPE